MNAFRKILPGLVLLFLAPVLGELIVAHQTPLEFISPLNFLLLSLPYGFGALVCREMIVRWRKGWLALILLGLAYGVFEEGLVVYSLFDPQWTELGPLASYGFAAGINWTWAAMTIYFHALVSIGASIVIAEIIFPTRRTEPWLNKYTLAACCLGLLLWILVLGSIMHSDAHRAFPAWYLYLLAFLVTVFLVMAARLAPANPLPTLRVAGPVVTRKVIRPLAFFLLGFVNMLVYFVVVFLTAELNFPPMPVTMLFLVLWAAGSLALVLYWSGNARLWDDRHRLALFAGFLGFFILFSILQDLEFFQGFLITGAAAIIALGILWRRVNLRVEGSAT